MRLAFRTVAAVVLVVLALLLVGPQQLGGPVALVSTVGGSMAPTYQPHDLVVAVRDSSYAVGDVVAYRSETLDTVVLHRIVDVEGDSYVFQGDNNDWLDPDQPAEDRLLGTARLRIPQAGRLLELPVPFRVAGGVALATLLIGVGGLVHPRRRSRSKPQRPPRRPRTRWRVPRRRARDKPRRTAARRASWVGWPAQVVAMAAVVGLAGVALAAVSFTRPTTGPGEVDYTHHGTFDYVADAPAGAVYPDGQVTTGDPVFLQLVDTIDVSFAHRLASDAPSDVTTSGRLRLELTDGSGWSRSLPVGEEVTADGGDTLVLTQPLDVPRLQRMFVRAQRATGMGSAGQSITVTAETETAGTLAGEDFSDRSTFAMSFQLGESRLLALPTASDDQDGTGSGDAFSTVEEATQTVAGIESARLGLGPFTLAVADARMLAMALLALALLALMITTVGAVRRRKLDEAQRVNARYGHRLVEVDEVTPSPEHGIVDVADVAALVRLAEQGEGPILYCVQGTSHTYVVEGQAALYRHRIDLDDDSVLTRTAATDIRRYRPAAQDSGGRSARSRWGEHADGALFRASAQPARPARRSR